MIYEEQAVNQKKKRPNLEIEIPKSEYSEESSLDDGNGGNCHMVNKCDDGSAPASKRHKRSRSENLKEVVPAESEGEQIESVDVPALELS